MKKALKSLDGKKIKVGAEGENAWLSRIHEYGCKIPVTPKMRAYLHHQGLHLKASTTVVTIPERSFLRASWDAESKKVIVKAKKALPDVLTGSMSTEEYCKMVGIMLTSMVKDYARDLSKPANHPFTIEQKSSSNPLVDTGSLIESITYEVEG